MVRTKKRQGVSARDDGLITTVERALELASNLRALPFTHAPRERLSEALEEALKLLESWPVERVGEPLRSLHHFACTGGTLISKCVASLPNVQLLSEVDPLSEMHLNPERPTFSPRDLITQLRQSTRGTTEEVLVELFQHSIRIAYDRASQLGRRLVIRDHAHSHFCLGREVPQRMNCRELLPSDIPALSIVTVRHPIESFSSLASNGWVTFEPGTLDEYCRRYLLFMKSYEGVPVERYEDFVTAPLDSMDRVCKTLELPCNPFFIDLFPWFKITGDSGRSGETIEARPARPVHSALKQEMLASSHYRHLVEMLNYDPRPPESM